MNNELVIVERGRMMRKSFIVRRRFLIVCLAAILFAAANVFQYKYFTGRIRTDAALYTERERGFENRYAELAAKFNVESAPAHTPMPTPAPAVQAERGQIELAAAEPPVRRTVSAFTETFTFDENWPALTARAPEIEFPKEEEIQPVQEIPQEAEIVPEAEPAPAADFRPAVNIPLSPRIPPPSVTSGRGRLWIPPVSVGLGVEVNNNHINGSAEGVTAAADFRALSFLAAGARAGFSSNFGYSNTMEGEGFVRFILPVKTPLRNWTLELFAQGGAGISQIFVYEGNSSKLLAGGGLGIRLLNNGFYIEALARAGTPFLWGAGVSAGYRFGSEE
jgi:hypothetical protein